MLRHYCVFACALTGVLCFSSGCAFVDQKVELKYSEPVSQCTGAGPIDIAKPIDPVLETTKKGLPIVGTVENTYGMKTADTVTEDSVCDWIAGALEIELRAAGFTPRRVDALAPGAHRGVETRIIKVWVDQDPGFWTVGALGEVQLRVALYEGGQKIKEFDVDAKGQGERGVVGDAVTKSDSLEAALQECMKETVPMIAETFAGSQ